MNINFIYDASVSSAPAGFKTALNTVAQELSQVFADPITINIQVGWGFVNGVALSPTDVGETSVQSLKLGAIGLTYAALKTDLMQHATSIEDVIAINNLPASDPFGGPYYISSAQQKAGDSFRPITPQSMVLSGSTQILRSGTSIKPMEYRQGLSILWRLRNMRSLTCLVACLGYNSE